MGSTREMRVVAFFTDAAAMDKSLQGLGSQEIPEAGAGSGSGSGRGSSSRTPRAGSGSAK
jgi:hypothetical protein